MQHRVAVGADRDEVVDRVYLVLPTEGPKRHDVVDVDEALAHTFILAAELEATHGAGCSMMGDAFVPGPRSRS